MDPIIRCLPIIFRAEDTIVEDKKIRKPIIYKYILECAFIITIGPFFSQLTRLTVMYMYNNHMQQQVKIISAHIIIIK